MILVDTSIWIEFLRGSSGAHGLLSRELEAGNVYALECIFGELLQGARDDRERAIITGYWEHLPKVDQDGLWIAAGETSGRDALFAKGVGLIDAVILLAARKAKARLWTLDKQLSAMLSEDERFQP